MIDLYSWQTSNGRKASIMLEELGTEYVMHPVNINADEQFAPAFLAINPNGRIPAIVDHDGPGGTDVTVFESGAILMYLAEKFGQFMPTDPAARYDVLQWLMWQMGGVGPMFGQAHHFRRAAKEKYPYGIERYTNEARRLWGVLDTRLADHAYVAGAEYTIADIAIYPWTARYEWQGIVLDEFPNVARWFAAISDRPAVARGMKLPPLPGA